MFINVDTVLSLTAHRARLLAHLNLANELAQRYSTKIDGKGDPIIKMMQNGHECE